MISSTVCTTLSGGRPPSFTERSMLPREAYIRMPSSSAARELRAEQVAGVLREDVVVVEAGGAAVLHQLAHAGEGGEAD